MLFEGGKMNRIAMEGDSRNLIIDRLFSIRSGRIRISFLKYNKLNDAKITEAVQKMQKQLDQAEIFFGENNIDQAESPLKLAFQKRSQADLIDDFFIQVLAYYHSSQKKYEMFICLLKSRPNYSPKP